MSTTKWMGALSVLTLACLSGCTASEPEDESAATGAAVTQEDELSWCTTRDYWVAKLAAHYARRDGDTREADEYDVEARTEFNRHMTGFCQRACKTNGNVLFQLERMPSQSQRDIGVECTCVRDDRKVRSTCEDPS